MANLDDEVANLFGEIREAISSPSGLDRDVFEDIRDSLEQLNRNISQSRLQDSRGSTGNWRDVGRGASRFNPNRRDSYESFDPKEMARVLNHEARTFFDGVEEALKEGLKTDEFKRQLQSSLDSMAKTLGTDIEHLGGSIGKQLTSSILNSLGGSKLGSSFGAAMTSSRNYWTGVGQRGMEGFASSLKAGKLGSAAVQGVKGVAGQAIGAAGGLPGMALLAGVTAIDATLGKILNAFGAYVEGLKKSATRDMAYSRKLMEEGQKRLSADINAVVSAPYKVLEDATNRMIKAWEDGISVINQTQGYSKAELQDLIGSYATRLRSEGLESVVSAADFTTNLSNVLRSGLSGKTAEEFAYLATKLNQAVPTQDFFNYAPTYASLVGNAIKNGKSQAAAIEDANEQLELFASNVLYASRQLSGGLSTSLADASDLFRKASQIAISSKVGDPSTIAGVLTAVSAITSATAPDLASSIVDAVYNAAVGGNSSQIVALRSLAGINASNTEFLQAFVKNPQQVFTTLFTNLARMQNMSSSNYMEVAEGLESVFGISKESFAQVDFNYLAQAVSGMSVSTASLEENMKELASGESTLSAEQLRMEQINKYMITEGLSYVLDNEVARSVQENMWAEQRNLELMENTFAVDLQGAAAEALQRLKELGSTILNILSLGIKPLANIEKTRQEQKLLDERIAKVLEAGKIGQGNQQVLSQLLTKGKDLNLVSSYASMLNLQKWMNMGGSTGYTWGSVGKSLLSRSGISATGSAVGSILSEVIASPSASNSSKLQSAFDKMSAAMGEFVSTSYQKRVDDAIKVEQTKLASKKITQSQIEKLAKKYMEDPEKYGIGSISYVSKLGTLAEDAKGRALEIAMQRAEEDLRKQLEQDSKAQATSRVQKMAASGKFGSSGYDAWLSTASKYGISDFATTVSELGYNESDIQSYFDNMEAQAYIAEAKQREQDEEAFWANTQEALNLLNVNIHDVLDKGDLMGIFWPGMDMWLADIDSNGTADGPGFRGEMNTWLSQIDVDINSFHTDLLAEFTGFKSKWEDYYIKHTTYNQHLTGDVNAQDLLTSLKLVQKNEQKTTEDVLNTLTDLLMKSSVEDLLDPTVQQNLFLASILQGVQTIIQQNNTQGKLQLPDAIAALATGMQVTTTSAR